MVTKSPSLEDLAGGRRHAAHLAAADADDHEILVDAFRTEEPFDLGHQLVILGAGPGRGAEDFVAAVRNRGSAAHVHELVGPLAHQERLDQRRSVGQAQHLGMAHEPVREEMIRRACNAAVAASDQKVLGRLDEIRGPHDLVGCFGARPLRFGRIVEQQNDGAVAFEERETLSLDDAEVARIAQEVGVPVVAVDEQAIDVRGLHGAPQIVGACAIRGRHGACIGACHDANP